MNQLPVLLASDSASDSFMLVCKHNKSGSKQGVRDHWAQLHAGYCSAWTQATSETKFLPDEMVDTPNFDELCLMVQSLVIASQILIVYPNGLIH